MGPLILDMKIREDALPFACQNPACNQQYDAQTFRDVLNLWGLVYADCGDFIYQGITCPRCKKTSIKPAPRNDPIVDLRDFIIVPNANPAANTWEQYIERERAKDEKDQLNFRFIPAWDDETVSYADIINRYPSSSYSLFTTPGVPYLMMIPGDVERKLVNENDTGEIQLRRLYPDTAEFRNLLTIMTPGSATDIKTSHAGPSALRGEGGSEKESEDKYNAWIGLLEQVAGGSLTECAKEYLESLGYSGFDPERFDVAIKQYVRRLYSGFSEQIRDLSTKVGFEEKIWDLPKEALEDLTYPVCTDLAVVDKRKEFIEWVEKLEGLRDSRKALFIDAPMGLGKTCSIIEALVENTALSAVIFMPTNRLCKEVAAKLKLKIALKRGLKYWEYFQREKSLLYWDLKREFLEKEVYLADGISKDQCPYFTEIMERYRENWTKMRDICKGCEKRRACGFLLHEKKAPESRIVVTTHQQYGRFYQVTSIRKWLKNGLDTNDGVVPRDVYIVDEDMVLSHCYQPIGLNREEIADLCTTLTGFLSDFGENQQVEDKIKRLFGQSGMPGKTSIIPPVDPDFEFSKAIVEKWDETFSDQTMFVPEYVDSSKTVVNHLELIQNALRLGVVVEKGSRSTHRHGKGEKEKIEMVFLPNPKTLDLSELPPHVFFDCTRLDDKFLKKKVRHVDFERMRIDVKPRWQLRVWQNQNTDLPQRWIPRDEPNVKKFVRELFDELGKNHQFFFVTTKAIREGYLDDFLEQEYQQLAPLVVHYGNLNGFNKAKACDVGIMLGSSIPSNGVEIATALEFLQDKLPKNQITPTSPDLWTWNKRNGQRVYKEEYAIVGELARSVRFCEQRQAIASTRYLFHDVRFYILSKDPVCEYEPFLTKTETDQYRADIFPPKPTRSDSKYEQVKEAVFELVGKHNLATEMEIHHRTGISRTTLRKHLKRMLDEGLIVRAGTKYKRPPLP